MILKKAIQGERIFLDSLDPSAISTEYQAWMKDPEVLKYLANPDGDYSNENLRSFVEQANQSKADQIFGIFLNDSRKHIGNIKINNIHPKHKYADVGVIIGDKTQWGKGFATEAIRLAVCYAFTELKLRKVYAGIIAGNDGSKKAFLKAGFKEAGCLRKHYLLDGHYCDSYLVEILNDHEERSGR